MGTTKEPGESAQNPAIEMPAPDYWPMMLAFGVALLFAGFLTHYMLAVAGLAIAARAATGWWRDVIPTERHELVPVNVALRPTPIVADARSVVRLKAGEASHRVSVPEKIHPYSSGIWGGLCGGAVMALLACLYGLIAQHSIWYPINLLAGVVLPWMGSQGLEQLRAFNAWGFAAALAGHIGISILVGIIYAAILPMFPKNAPFWGGILVPLFWTGLTATTLDVLNPALNERINWYWFVASQLAYGLVAGFVIARSTNISTLQSWDFASRAFVHAPGLRPPRDESQDSPNGGQGGGPEAMNVPTAAMFLGVCGALMMMQGCAKPEGPALAEDVTDFPTLFSENCSGCHGAEGRNGGAQTLNYPLYLAFVPRDTLIRVISEGRPGTSMSAFAKAEGGPLNDKQLTALVDGMKKNWGKPVDFRLPPYSYSGPADAARGQELFRTNCFVCHGPKGMVGPVDDPSYLTLVSDQSLRTSIVVGRPALGMPDWRKLKLGQSLEDQDIADLAGYLASRRPALSAARLRRQAGANEQGSGRGNAGARATGDEGSGNGPGSPDQREQEGNSGKGSSSIQAGPGQSHSGSQPIKHQ